MEGIQKIAESWYTIEDIGHPCLKESLIIGYLENVFIKIYSFLDSNNFRIFTIILRF